MATFQIYKYIQFNKYNMTKINFTKTHFDKMCTLALNMLFNNSIILSKFNTPINIIELLHTTTINMLNSIKVTLSKKIEQLESQDEWVASDTYSKQLEEAKEQKELVNLIIGYKRYKMEQEETAKRKLEIVNKLQELKESQKTPEDKIKELETELSKIDNVEDF